ncbi:ATP-binding cassette domain-containing protein [Thermococcus sp.]|uniref:ATP-binding cassette domain-containing protein n=1 Tax=Thermococcus sp. TaxID=35749 RepID=UPI002614811C|nr:ABC transporter ATP-binding protein [Thermococcus sp.]
MITAENLTKRFGRVVALDGVDLELPEGVILILGPNGGGKSTFLKITAGIYRPTGGEIRVFGLDPWRSEDLKLRVGVSFDPPALPSLITGREWLELIAEVKGFDGGEVERVAGLFGIDYLDGRIGNYSSGMRKNLSLAGAFVGGPELVLLDEPLANMDFDNVRRVVRILRRLRGDTNFVIISHIWKPLYSLVDFVAVLAGGKLILSGEREDVRGEVERLFDYGEDTGENEGLNGD